MRRLVHRFPIGASRRSIPRTNPLICEFLFVSVLLPFCHVRFRVHFRCRCPATTTLTNSDEFRTFSCRSVTRERLLDAVQSEDGQVSLPEVSDGLQPEEQSLLARKVRVRTTAAVRLSLLSVHLEEVVQHTRPCAQEAPRLRSQSPSHRERSLTSPRKTPLRSCTEYDRIFTFSLFLNLGQRLKSCILTAELRYKIMLIF